MNKRADRAFYYFDVCMLQGKYAFGDANDSIGDDAPKVNKALACAPNERHYDAILLACKMEQNQARWAWYRDRMDLLGVALYVNSTWP